jgi:hypothetical protein
MSGGGSQTTTATSEPWSDAQPYLRRLFGQAERLPDQQYFPDSTVVPFSDQTQQALNTLEQNAQGAPLGFDQLSETAQDIAARNPLPGQSTLNQYAQNLQTNPFTSQITQAGQTPTTAGVQALEQMSGSGTNPHLDQMFGRVSDNIQNSVNSVFSKGGRYGSVAHQDQMADSIGDAAASFYGQQYNMDQNRRMGAAGQLAGISQADRAAAMGGLQAGAGLTENAYDRMLGAADEANNTALNQNTQALQAAGLMPQINDYQNANARQLAQVGGAYEDLSSRQLQDAMNRHNFDQQQPYDRLSYLSGIYGGLGVLGGTNTATAPGQSALAGGAQGALGGAMGAAAFGFNPLIGGGLGLFGGLL